MLLPFYSAMKTISVLLFYNLLATNEIYMKNTVTCTCHSGVDEMINEGLGGGFIIYEYDTRKPEPKQMKSEAKEISSGHTEGK